VARAASVASQACVSLACILIVLYHFLVSLFPPQQSTTEYAAAIHLATMSQTINRPYHFHVEAYKHLIKFAESDPAASNFLGSLLT
jgi:hypothetical protein